MPRSPAVRLGLLLVLGLASSCEAFRTTPIQEILDRPEKFDGRSVRVAGQVTSATNLLVLRYYKVKDEGGGEILVITTKAVPRRGAKVKVSGVVHQAFAVAGEYLTVISEDSSS